MIYKAENAWYVNIDGIEIKFKDEPTDDEIQQKLTEIKTVKQLYEVTNEDGTTTII